jgi:hypothetical protein
MRDAQLYCYCYGLCSTPMVSAKEDDNGSASVRFGHHQVLLCYCAELEMMHRMP